MFGARPPLPSAPSHHLLLLIHCLQAQALKVKQPKEDERVTVQSDRTAASPVVEPEELAEERGDVGLASKGYTADEADELANRLAPLNLQEVSQAPEQSNLKR